MYKLTLHVLVLAGFVLVAAGCPNGSPPPDSEPASAPVQPMDDPGSEPMDEPGSEPMDEPGSEPMDEPGSEPMDEPGSEPMDEPGSEGSAAY